MFPKNRIVWCSDFFAGNGYGSASYNLAIGLERLGYDVRLLPFTPPNELMHAGLPEEAKAIMRKPFAFGDTCVIFTVPYGQDSAHYAPWHRVGFSMFETTKLPSQWAQYFEGQELTLVPCPQNVDSFRAGGVATPLEIVPLGLDVERYPFSEPPSLRSDPFTFLLPWGDWRKGMMEAYQAFRMAFGDSEHHRLILKTHSLGYDLKIHDRNVTLITDFVPDDQMRTLLRACHVGLYPSKGEGYGLDARAHILMGRPVIVAGFSGLEPLKEYRTVTAIPPDHMAPAKLMALRFEQINPKWGRVDCGDWAIVTAEQLAEAMTRVYEQWSGCWDYEALADAAQVLATKESRERAAETLANTLSRHGLLV